MSAFGHCSSCPTSTRPTRLTAGLCAYHFANPSNKVETPTEEPSVPVADFKPKQRIKPCSKKRACQLAKYRKMRLALLALRNLCEANLEGCTLKATELHHLGGKSGEKLIEVKNVMCICRHCHDILHANPAASYKAGLLLKRIT